MGNIVSVFFGQYRSVFLSIYHTDTEGKLGQYFRYQKFGGAQALRRTDIGIVSVGKRADLVLLNTPSYIHLAYRPGVNLVHSTYKSGRAVTSWQK